MPKDIERKIAVIFVTDVVGFSKSMERNEDETLRSFRSCRDILDNLFEQHGGRIFNTAGDSVLAEFQSAVSALICAKDFQKLVRARNENVSEESVMRFRIGLNMGDVIDIYPAESERNAIRIELFDDEIERLSYFDPLTGSVIRQVPRLTVFPKSHYVLSLIHI